MFAVLLMQFIYMSHTHITE